MKYILVPAQISMLFLFYYIGEWIQDLFSLLIPGSIIGMLLFFLLLQVKAIRVHWIEKGIDLLLKDMPIFFVPVTVGIVEYLDFLNGKGILILPIAFVSTLIVTVITAIISQKILHKRVESYE
ncbi:MULTISPECIES: CidA/LrgA family protein [Gracilibacillus]|uniref:CidA/LrgA family holin-like protein n=1 Tax=Gracilibacillus dipsosauri TaxID=178340 RepID=A0A317KVY6_9BACI|nr:CidA/LrgA family protein [Gracilibacillus dipsosauri]PWU66850.1 CidA/LrgA family holin-like protein [Gracilibacillus dipsosauri]